MAFASSGELQGPLHVKAIVARQQPDSRTGLGAWTQKDRRPARKAEPHQRTSARAGFDLPDLLSSGL